MKPTPSLITILSITGMAGLCLVGAALAKADNIADWPDPTKHHHYANPDGKSVFADPNNVMAGHYNYNIYYAGNGRIWHSDMMASRDSSSSPSQSYSVIVSSPDQSSSGGTGSDSSQSSGSGASGQSLSDQSSGSSSQLDQNQAPAPVNRASNLIGMTVKNSNGETLGTIKDVVFNLQSGRVAYVVLQKAGQDQGANSIAVPLAAFTPSSDNSSLTLNADKSKLQSSRSFAPNNLPSIGSQSYGAEPVREHIIIVPVPSSHLNPSPGQDPDLKTPDSNQEQDQDQHHQPESKPDTDKGQSS
ncbi:MAG: photosystem reaction center subunit [Pedosphaera sp.]|nr:photosystem reaction center subunit [Pedosphaera sp.]